MPVSSMILGGATTSLGETGIFVNNPSAEVLPSYEPGPFWSVVTRLQQQANRRHLDHRVWVDEERLDELLSRADQSDLSAEELAKLSRQVQNRAKKHLRRKHIRTTYAHTRPEYHSGQFDAVEARDAVEALRRRVSKAVWGLFQRVTEAPNYKTLAAELGVPVGTLKAKVSRVRAQVREYNPAGK